jgi:hypothetical protein
MSGRRVCFGLVFLGQLRAGIGKYHGFRRAELPSTGLDLRDIMSREVASQGGSRCETEIG